MIGRRTLVATSMMLGPLLTECMGQVSFQKEVHPILQANCAMCHAPHGVGYARSGFSVQTYWTVMRGTKYGTVVIPGSSTSSDLVWLLEHQADPSIDMPKVCMEIGQKYAKCAVASQSARWLPEHELILIKKWVDEGAKDN